MNLAETSNMIAVIQGYYPSWSINELTPKFWHSVMEKFSYEDAVKAVQEIAETTTSSYAPSVGQIIHKIVDMRVPACPSSDEAWRNVLYVVGKLGWKAIVEGPAASNPTYLTPAEHRAAWEIGWKDIALTDERYRRPLEENFKKRYAELVAAERQRYASGELALPMPPNPSLPEANNA